MSEEAERREVKFTILLRWLNRAASIAVAQVRFEPSSESPLSSLLGSERVVIMIGPDGEWVIDKTSTGLFGGTFETDLNSKGATMSIRQGEVSLDGIISAVRKSWQDEIGRQSAGVEK